MTIGSIGADVTDIGGFTRHVVLLLGAVRI